MRMSLSAIVPLTLITAALAWGCTKTPKKGAAEAPAAEQAAAPAEAGAEGDKTPAGDDSKAAGTDKPAEPTTGEAKPEPPKAEPLSGDKAKLAKAYIDIYCAQRKGETEKLLEIYTRYGFEDPKTWTEQWTGAAKDKAWVARITQEAIRACP